MTEKHTMSAGYKLTDSERHSRGIYNKKGDRVQTERVEQPFTADVTEVQQYIDFTQIGAPTAPDTGKVRFYSRSTGTDSDLFIQDSSGTVLELATLTNLDLDDAYNNGSTVVVDSTDFDLQLTGTKFEVTNTGGGTNYFNVSTTAITADLPVNINDTLTATNIGAFTATGAIDFGSQNMTNVDIDSGTVDGITSLTVANDVDIGAHELRAATFESDITTGTAPLSIASTTVVSNLNADQVDGKDSTDLILADGTQALTADWDVGSFTLSAAMERTYVYDSAMPAVVTATWTPISFDTESYDVGDMHEGVTNPTRITFATAGQYLITCQISWPANGTGRRIQRLYLNGATVILQHENTPPSSTYATTMTGVINVSANDYIEWELYQSSGGDLTPGSGQYASFVNVHRLLGT